MDPHQIVLSEEPPHQLSIFARKKTHMKTLEELVALEFRSKTFGVLLINLWVTVQVAAPL